MLGRLFQGTLARRLRLAFTQQTYFERLLRRINGVGYVAGGRVEGFVAFGFKKLDPDHELRQDLEVRTLVYLRRTALFHAQGDVAAIGRLLSTGMPAMGAVALALLAGFWLALPFLLRRPASPP